MAKIKTDREQQYRAILAKDGKRIEDYKVVAFTFKEPNGPERLHYGLLLADPRPEYILFDCFGTIAQIIVADDAKTIKQIQELAKQLGGEKTSPNLR